MMCLYIVPLLVVKELAFLKGIRTEPLAAYAHGAGAPTLERRATKESGLRIWAVLEPSGRVRSRMMTTLNVKNGWHLLRQRHARDLDFNKRETRETVWLRYDLPRLLVSAPPRRKASCYVLYWTSRKKV